VQFISDALRAGERAILVTGRGQFSIRVPEAALAALVGNSARVVHITPPLPEPPELQEMIGAAAGIAGGRGMTPEAMARLLLLADPRQTVILAIDDAHTLPQRSLSYLALMTDLTATGAPVLQILLAAGSALLDRLAQPKFETLRNRLTRAEFATFENCTAYTGELTEPSQGHASTPMIAPQLVWHPSRASTRWRLRRGIDEIARSTVYAAVGVLATSCLAAIGYIAFVAFTHGPSLPPTPSLESAALQKFVAPSDPSQSPAQLDPRQTDEEIDALIDKLVDAVARGSFGLVSEGEVLPLLERIAKLQASASPDGLKLVIAMPDRFAARAGAAAAAGRIDEARRLEKFFGRVDSSAARPDHLTASNQADGSFQSARAAVPDASNADTVGVPSQQVDIALAPALPPSGSATSAGQLGAADDADRAAHVPLDQSLGATPPSGSAPQLVPEAAPTSPNSPDQPPPKADQREGIDCPPRDTFENAQAWVHERLNCERHPTPNEPWIEWAEYCPSGPLGYFVLKVKAGQQKVYLFENIPPAVWEGFKAAPAAGKFYHGEIKGKRHWFQLASELKPSTCRR
jgi:KTSC domain